MHASCVSMSGQALLIVGDSGSGKSALALQLLAFGCDLVADDRVSVSVGADGLTAEAPPSLPKLIEARGIGLLRSVICEPARLCAVVDMNTLETDRLPPARKWSLLGQDLPLFLRVEGPHFAAALAQMMKYGWYDPE
ncbi:HPr kinase/phosphorylase [Falsiruegeria litorea]|uniref:HPr kinase/phosphorylase n=1 Tax=Falsiruegeria litorea TaxID=1280831 RepID=UPI0027BA36BD|nr:serine kinase [Falsiruegeria litorea]